MTERPGHIGAEQDYAAKCPIHGDAVICGCRPPTAASNPLPVRIGGLMRCCTGTLAEYDGPNAEGTAPGAATGYEKLSWRYRLVLFRRIPGHVRYYGLRATGAWVYERVIRGVRRAS